MDNNDTQNLHQQLQDYENLLSLFQTVGSKLEVEDILRQIIDGALALCNADQGAIMLFDPISHETAKTLIRQRETTNELLDHYLSTLLSGWVLDTKSTQLTNNLLETFGAQQIKAKYHSISAVLSVPLVWRDDIIGVINLLSLDSSHKFGERELRLMGFLATQAAQFIANARLREELFAEAKRLRHEVQDRYAVHGIVGHSPKMQEMFALLERVIPTEGRILLEGESGTGKELVARVIHYGGPRKDGPFVAVDCGALLANLLESELFSYVKGAFTGALRDKQGLMEGANNGTLFLDEIVNMPQEVQVKLLRAIQEGEIRPLGSTQVKKIEVRIIAAASANLRMEVEAGRFRQDLFYRLNVVTIPLPSLRERTEDIAILANHFLKKMMAKHGKSLLGFKPETVVYLESYHWPGNVRELENVVERMVILAEPEQNYVTPELLPMELRAEVAFAGLSSAGTMPPAHGMLSTKEAREKTKLFAALARHNWNQSEAAKELGIHESTVRYRMQKYGITRQ